ncbi:MAG: hypothetical protein DRI80_17170 [Chloroflexota bacterium]|nr:MAG: hypothetical protein DRI80_17170 [Chloroflexota bacterium]
MAAFYQEVYDLQPWYHDFARLGLKTRFDKREMGLGRRLVNAARMLLSLKPRQLLGTRLEKREILSLREVLGERCPPHFTNQLCKERVLIPYLTRCLKGLEEHPTCLDLFCADGYYSCMMADICPGARITGIDLAAMEIKRARTAARLLGFDNIEFIIADAWAFIQEPHRYDLVLCAGGLYHLEEPRRFLVLLRPITAHYLVVQSVVTLETEDPNYFVTPAPGAQHGSRFTHAALECWLGETGWEILDQTRNELTGNRLRCDRGSSYFLCRAA